MKPVIVSSLSALLLLATQSAVYAQRGFHNPYPQYPQSPPGGGYLTEPGAAEPDGRPALQRCVPVQAGRRDC